MKKFIALAAVVLVSMATTTMYAQESRAEKRADRKAQRDAERARLKAEEQAQDAISYDDAMAGRLCESSPVRNGGRPSDVPQRTDRICKLQHQLRIGQPRTWHRAGSLQHRIPRS